MRVNPVVVMLTSLGLWLVPVVGAFAQDATAPTPRIVIYPGDVIHDEMLTDLPANTAMGPGPFALMRSAAVGKMSRRTLLPGAPIPLAALDNPRLVRSGGEVQIIYIAGGLTIAASGAALQDGAIGDVIKVRNSDSGVTVTGAVQADGSVRVSG